MTIRTLLIALCWTCGSQLALADQGSVATLPFAHCLSLQEQQAVNHFMLQSLGVSQHTKDFSQEGVDPEDIYKATVMQVALYDKDYKTAAPIAMELAKSEHSSYLAQLATGSYLQLDDYKNALMASSFFKLLEPHSQDAQRLYLYALAKNGEIPELKKAFSALLAKDSNFSQGKKSDALGLVFQVLEEFNNKKEAFDIYQSVTPGPAPRDDQYYVFYIMLAIEGKQPDKAWKRVEMFLKHNPDSEEAVILSMSFLRYAQQDRVQAIIDEYIKKHPENTHVRIAYAKALLDLHAPEKAKQQLKLLQQQNPQDADVWLSVAKLDYALGDYVDSERHVQIYLTKKQAKANVDEDEFTQVMQARYLLAEVLDKQGKYRQAIEALSTVNMPEKAFMIRLQKASEYIHLKDYDKAQELVDQFLPSDQGYSDSLLLGVSLSLDQKRMDQAIAYLKKLQAIDSNDVAVYEGLAYAYDQKGDWQGMQTNYEKALSLSPHNPRILNNYGYSLAHRNLDLDKAEKLLKEAIDQVPDSPSFLDSYGWLQFKKGNLEQAQQYLEQAWDKEQQAEIAAHLASLYKAQGQKAKAYQMLKKGQAIDPKDPEVIETLKEFKEGKP